MKNLPHSFHYSSNRLNIFSPKKFTPRYILYYLPADDILKSLSRSSLENFHCRQLHYVQRMSHMCIERCIASPMSLCNYFIYSLQFADWRKRLHRIDFIDIAKDSSFLHSSLINFWFSIEEWINTIALFWMRYLNKEKTESDLISLILFLKKWSHHHICITFHEYYKQFLDYYFS